MIDFSTSAGAGKMNSSSFISGSNFNFTKIIEFGIDFIAALLVLAFLLILLWSLFELFNVRGQAEYTMNVKKKLLNTSLVIMIVFMSDILANYLLLNISNILS